LAKEKQIKEKEEELKKCERESLSQIYQFGEKMKESLQDYQ
jgi:hypothetical protein